MAAFIGDVRMVARRSVIEAGFVLDLPPDAQEQLARLREIGVADVTGEAIRDLRALPWISIDAADTRDLDQVTVAETLPAGTTRVRVGIADVDIWVPRDSPLDRHAARNALSVYTGIETFHMLPVELATGQTSLLPGTDRLALVMDFVVDSTGAVRTADAYRALICNHAQLDDELVGAWLAHDTVALPQIAHLPWLSSQLQLQEHVAHSLHDWRKRRGAQDMPRLEVRPIFDAGRVVDLVTLCPNGARVLTEQLMVAANSVAATLLSETDGPWIARGQAVRDWHRIVDLAAIHNFALPSEPEAAVLTAFLDEQAAVDPHGFPALQAGINTLLGGSADVVVTPQAEAPRHFGLALDQYTRITAPNRRYLDLVTQRVLKAVIAHQPMPYTAAELAAMVTHGAERARAAWEVERTLVKLYAILLLQDRHGVIFDAVVTTVNDWGVWARLAHPPVEGRIMRGDAGLAIGDRVRVRLLRTDWERGFINLERVVGHRRRAR